MSTRIKERKIVIVNQAVNYLTVGIANAFAERFENVSLITGNVHEQDEKLNSQISISFITKYKETSTVAKFLSFIKAFFQIVFLLGTKYRKYEVFFVSVPPFSYFSMFILWHRFSILIWDVYPDSLKIYRISEKNIVYRFWVYVNRRLFKKAYRLFTIGEKMAELLSKYIAKEKLIVSPLWTTFSTFDPPPAEKNIFIEQHNLQNKFIVQYSGNIGATHNVEVLVEAAKFLKDNAVIQFLIIGKGERIHKLNEMIHQYQLHNVMILPFQPDEMFPYSLASANLGVVVLDDQTSKGSVPSKTYNLMTAGIPVLYISSQESELAVYAKKYQNGSCFRSDQIEAIANFILQVSQDKSLFEQMKLNSVKASLHYKRNNADLLVNNYI